MKDQFVAGLVEGMAVDTRFAVRSRDLRAARTGDAYLVMELADRTGSISAVMFRPGPEEWSIPPGTVVTVRGTVTSFRGARRVSVSAMRPTGAYDRRDMIPAGKREPSELMDTLRMLIGDVGHPGLRTLLDAIFADPHFVSAFGECPASRSHHHCYAGGLLEHTVSVASLCRALAPRYDGIDRDLIVTAALLHDVGKVEELSFDTAVDLTEEGRLLGHVVLGQSAVARAIDGVGERLPRPLALRLLHVLVSHHGRLEWGAAARPAMLEALLLHHADHLDAQMSGFMEAVAGAGALDESWTGAENRFGHPLVVPGVRPAPGRDPACAA